MSLILDVKGWFYSWICVIPKFLYLVCTSLCSLLDAFQLLLRKVAGLDVYYVDGNAETGDIALSFIKSLFESNPRFPAIKNAFWSLVILAVLLLVVVTIVSIIRQEYTKGKADNNKLTIIGQSIKSLFLFLIVPVSCIFGLMLSDIILKTLDNVTTGGQVGSTLFSAEGAKSNLVGEQTLSGEVSYTYFDVFGFGNVTTTTTFSGVMFKTAAFEANRARLDKDFNGQTFVQRVRNGSLSNFGIFNLATSDEECAQMIDDAFANCVKLNSNNNKIVMGEMESTAGSGLWSLNDGTEVVHLSKFRVSLVWYFYDLWRFNYLIGFAFIIVGLKLMFNIVLGLMKRIVEMTALFIISPPLIATMPLDDGKAFNKWRESFLSKALAAYGAIIGMNLIFLILPYLNQIHFFNESYLEILNLLISSLFIIVGLMTVEGFIGLMSKMVGADDVYKSGSEMSKKIGEATAKAGKLTAAAVGVAVAGPAFAGKLAFNKFANSNAGKSVVNKMSNLKSNMFVSNKEKAKAESDAQETWEHGEGDRQYDEKMKSDSDYQQSLDDSWDKYRKHWKSKMSKDDWLKSESGKKALNKAENDYAKKTGTTRADFLKNSQERSDYIDRQAKANRLQYQSTRKKNIASKTGAVLKTTGMNQTLTLGALYLDEVKDSMVASGKGGLKSMVMAFSGKTNKEIEEAAIEKKLKKEEEQRQKARIDAANKK